MREDLLQTLSNVSATQLALESLRASEVPRALELLELNLDASVLALNRLAKTCDGADREQVIATMCQIRAYRQAHPRRTEADLGGDVKGLLVRSGQLTEGRVREILRALG
jgi:hypothetical protein